MAGSSAIGTPALYHEDLLLVASRLAQTREKRGIWPRKCACNPIQASAAEGGESGL